MAEPEERLRDEEDKLGSKVVVREEEQEARVRLDSQVDERRESEEGLRMRGGREDEEMGGTEGNTVSPAPSVSNPGGLSPTVQV